MDMEKAFNVIAITAAQAQDLEKREGSAVT
jgi:hypothetical protein